MPTRRDMSDYLIDHGIGGADLVPLASLIQRRDTGGDGAEILSSSGDILGSDEWSTTVD
ncbi:hypothetical protein SNOG_06758 [Parastagonospora nodorum SN15]|uniref:Uncharacterized protein n=1 Tax=Phaeosphaeria nodorum (strain SN15 / ATCC MYA-4574 / FGSC 10173) TaxID=321614 RepID=Q0UNA6_PHANO|nr:hypothetical protein SNOG_06758 [Parastagonospora nodorum SN15]EAT85409.1 hypothetical protein SNOG_06758 [Parastagonospora nodorum SN15]